MAAHALKYKELTPFGVETEGLDLMKPLSAEQEGALRRLYDQHYLIVFRDQPTLPRARHEAICALFDKPYDKPDTEYISNVKPDGGLGVIALAFHSNQSYSPFPDDGVSLYAEDVQAGKTSTRFANSICAVQKLRPELRQKLLRLHAFDALPTHPERRFRPEDRKEWRGPNWPQGLHDVIEPHRRTGVLCTRVNEMCTIRIAELDDKESDAALAEIFAAFYDPGNIYEHFWRNGDLLVWDNWALQHARPPCGPDIGNRTLQRVVMGKSPFSIQYANFDSKLVTKDMEAAE